MDNHDIIMIFTNEAGWYISFFHLGGAEATIHWNDFS